MLAFVQNNLATIIAGAVLLAAVAAILWSMRRRKKAGRSACGCGCEGCSASGVCGKKPK